MTTIDPTRELVTIINVFAVTPTNQQPLVELLIAVTDEVMRHQPGFISANIHTSLDGTRVVNYAQWRTREDVQRMLANPIAQQHMKVTAELGTPEPHLYVVAAVREV